MEQICDASQQCVDGSYLERNPGWHERDSAWKAAHVLELLSVAGISPESICDVGCGTGAVMYHLADRLPDTRFVGYEISPQAVALAPVEGRAEVEIILGDFRADERASDVVLALDVFEHVEDYLQFLRDLHCKASRAVFHIPLDMTVTALVRSGSGLTEGVRRHLGHLHYFNRETALATLRDTGWTPCSERITRALLENNSLGLLANLKWAPFRALSRLNPRAAAKLAHGFSLLVLAESEHAR